MNPTCDQHVQTYKDDVAEILQLCVKNKIQQTYLTTHITTYFEIQIKAGTIHDYKYTFRANTAPHIAIGVEVWFDTVVPYQFEVSSAMVKDDPIKAFDRAMGIVP